MTRLVDLPLAQMAIAERLNLLPEVRWDRLTNLDDEVTVYGWIEREEDNRCDFVVITFVLRAGAGISSEWWMTSSADRSQAIYERLSGRSDSDHVPCERVDELLGAAVANTTTRLGRLDYEGSFPLEFLRDGEGVGRVADADEGCQIVLRSTGAVRARFRVGDTLIRERDGSITVVRFDESPEAIAP